MDLFILIVFVFAFIIVAAIIKSFQPEKISFEETPVKFEEKRESDLLTYVKKGPILTPSERSFFKELSIANEGNRHIFTKVRLEDIIEVKKGLECSDSSWRSRIQSRHIDFVLCERDTMEIAVCIELDDKSHMRKKTMEQDAFVNQALKTAGVRIERVQVQSHYSPEFIRDFYLPPVVPFKSTN